VLTARGVAGTVQSTVFGKERDRVDVKALAIAQDDVVGVATLTVRCLCECAGWSQHKDGGRGGPSGDESMSHGVLSSEADDPCAGP
jgi:hypothetical protein